MGEFEYGMKPGARWADESDDETSPDLYPVKAPASPAPLELEPREPEEPRWLAVSQLSYSTTEYQLREFFESQRLYPSAVEIYMNQSGKSRGFGQVLFRNTADSDEALQMSGMVFMGRKLSIEVKSRDSGRSYSKPKSKSFEGHFKGRPVDDGRRESRFSRPEIMQMRAQQPPEAPSERPRLQLKPRQKPLDLVGTTVYVPSGSNPFGSGRSRDEVLAEREAESRRSADSKESPQIKNAEPKESASTRRHTEPVNSPGARHHAEPASSPAARDSPEARHSPEVRRRSDPAKESQETRKTTSRWNQQDEWGDQYAGQKWKWNGKSQQWDREHKDRRRSKEGPQKNSWAHDKVKGTQRAVPRKTEPEKEKETATATPSPKVQTPPPKARVVPKKRIPERLQTSNRFQALDSD